MWTTFQNSRPNHAAPFGQSKPLSSSFKDKFKIYTSVPFKTKIPVSEDSGRRRPVKAYTIRNITKFRPSQTNSSSPLKRDIKDFSPTAATPLDITGFKEREMSMLPMTQGMIVDSDTEVDKETFKVSDHIKEKALTPEMRGRTGQISYGLKELLIDPKTKNTGGTYNLDWAKEYQNGNSKFKRCWTAKGLGSIEKNMLLDEEKYKKDVDDCIDRYADDDGDVDRVKQDEIETQEPLESEENGRLRPRTVYASDDSGDGMPKTMEVVQVFPRKPSHSPTCLNVTVDMNIWEKYQEMQRPKDEDHLESSRVREMKIILDERSSAKYKQIKDSLKTGTFTRVHRYQYDAKRRTMVPSESPDKKGNTHRESSLLNKREDNMIHPLVSDNFIVEKVIGQGSYAVVRQVVERATGINYALKSYTKVKLNDVQRKENVKKEIEILKGLDHPNIIKLHKTIDTPTQLHLLLELGGSVSLQSYAKYKPQKRLLESEAKIVFRQLAEGLDYLHKNNVVHRDIKLDNILIDADKNIKIIDFGFSVASQKNKPMNIFCGTPSYMAPELVTRKYYFGHLVDIWALGISLYVMLCGFFPFKGITNKDLYNKIMRGQYQIPDYVSPEAKSLIRQMLRMNPHERPSASELLNDKWVTGEPEQQSSNLKDFLTSKIEEYRNLL